MSTGNRYSAEFKRYALDRLNESGLSANRAAKPLGVSPSTLSRWLREASHASSPSPWPATDMPSMSRLPDHVTELQRRVSSLEERLQASGPRV